ncbi:MAG: DUF3617 domain-containing protein [Betaproteobacteria bacterium]|nr:DUF3617 domain-containing protein [Betaproteobacteria bacterium]
MKYKLLGVLVGALFTSTAFAQSMKPGLWETTGQEFPEDPAEVKQRAKLSPAERKKMEDSYSQNMGRTFKIIDGRLTTTDKECVTPEEAKTIVYTPKAMGENMIQFMTKDMAKEGGIVCNFSLQVAGNTATVSSTCPVKPPLSGKAEGTSKLTLHSDTAYSSHQQTVINGQSFELNSSSRWLSANCGNVKPSPKEDEE